MSNKLSG